MTATEITLEIEDVAHGGHCVARQDGRVVFVRHALPGERVVARLTDAGPEASFWRADAVEILSASADRVPHVWPEAGPGGIGGAELGHVSLDGQLAWKGAVLRDAFERFAGLEFPGGVRRAPEDADGLGYRTRVEAVADAEGRAAMRAFRSHEIHTLTSMPLATADAERALLGQRFPAGARIGVVDASASGIFVTVDGARWHGGRRDMRENAPRRVREQVVVGERTLEYSVDATGFWQVHREAPSLLAGRVAALAGQGDAALELYSGAGLLTVPLADSFAAVVSIEADSNAVRAARRNLADSPHVRLVEGDVGARLAAGVGRHDVVVLDPPRSGAGRAILEAVAGTGARRIVYVACDPVALARDAGTLGPLGYELASAEAWDLFPMTHHVEAIAVFEHP